MMKFLPFEVGEIVKQGRKKEDHLKSAQVKMDEVREENERLKRTISQMMKDYQSLKMHFHDIAHDQDQPQKSTDSAPVTASADESELVSLRLGRFSDDTKREQKKSCCESKHQENRKQLGGLELQLENRLDGSKQEENNAFHKSTKTARIGDDEILEQNPMKKPRVSVRAVCDTKTMNDGCQWRKYGQKIAKGNPCPRAYYRCTISSSCPVRKQVQRCAENMSILTTTYEGTHNHPLPASATTMASATSAAAAMLKCSSAASSTSPNLLPFNFPSSNSLPTPCFPRASISTSQSHPTVILDLTAPNQTTSPHKPSSQSGIFSASPTTCLDFSNTLQSSFESKIRKAITRNPTFESALAAAITSFVLNGGFDNLDQERKLGQSAKWSKNINFSEPSGETIGCYWMNSHQQKKLASFSPFPCSASMAPTVFLPDDGEQIKL